MRTIIDLPEEDLKAIKAIARQERISQAEAIRRAVRGFLVSRPPPGREGQAFGLWAGREDGLAAQRRLRDEWPE